MNARARPFAPPRGSTARAVSGADVIGLVALAERLAALALDESLSDDGGEAAGLDLMRLRDGVKGLAGESFPSPAEPARYQFAAFLWAARAFAHPANGPETRTACAPGMRETARGVDRFLALHQTARAQSTWARQSGGTD